MTQSAGQQIAADLSRGSTGTVWLFSEESQTLESNCKSWPSSFTLTQK
ncbi:hypothetical protein OWR28_05680 [Chryseobacterium sp. 1B4]